MTAIRHDRDGDLHIDVQLDSGYRGLLAPGNTSQRHGDLVVEFMPRDGGHLPQPSVGDHLSLTGAWVDDTEHAWNELHPVWSVSINGTAAHTSGPQYGGSPPEDRSYNAAADCTTTAGDPCPGYRAGSGPNEPPLRAPPTKSGRGSSVHSGSGYEVTCRDGTISYSGGRPGACSHHGGVAP